MFRSTISTLPSTADVLHAFPEWILASSQPDWHVLDIGAGSGLTGMAQRLRPAIAQLDGVDPDESVLHNPLLDSAHQCTLEGYSHLTRKQYDCLYGSFVLEHVRNPATFLLSCKHLLKPGGRLFMLTPNLWHYFGLATTMSAKLGIEEWLLDRLLSQRVRETYHFPTAYRCNSVKKIRRYLARAGFDSVVFQTIDQTNRFQSYFPRGLKWFPPLYSRTLYAFRFPTFMGLLMFQARKSM